MKYYFSKRKPRKCPKCGSNKVATILFGLPVYSEKLQQDMDSGKIVLGGCCISAHDPTWQCVDCGTGIHKENLREMLK